MLRRRLVKKYWQTALVYKAGAVAFSLGALSHAHGQEAIRLNLANEQAAEVRKRALTGLGHYNLKIGSAVFSFTSSLGVGYSDNVDLSAGQAQADMFFQPQGGTRMRLPLTDRNSLDISIDAGYQAYLSYTRLSRFYITPSTEISFDMSVGNVLLNFHDRPSIQQNSYQDPTVSGRGDISRFENDLGVSALWDMNQVKLRSGYDHVNYISMGGSGQSYPDSVSDHFYLSSGYSPKEARLFGLETGLGLIEYDTKNFASFGTNSTLSGGVQWNVGAFYSDRLTDHIQVRASAGYTMFMPETTGKSSGISEDGQPYFLATLTHQIHPKISHSLSGGRMVNLAFYGGNYLIESLTWQAQWNIIRKMSLGTPVSFEHYSRVGNLKTGEDDFTRLSTGFNISRTLTEKLSASLAYQLILKESTSAASINYTVNTLTLSFRYNF